MFDLCADQPALGHEQRWKSRRTTTHEPRFFLTRRTTSLPVLSSSNGYLTSRCLKNYSPRGSLSNRQVCMRLPSLMSAPTTYSGPRAALENMQQANLSVSSLLRLRGWRQATDYQGALGYMAQRAISSGNAILHYDLAGLSRSEPGRRLVLRLRRGDARSRLPLTITYGRGLRFPA